MPSHYTHGPDYLDKDKKKKSRDKALQDFRKKFENAGMIKDALKKKNRRKK